jgi:hypothetical protein
MFYISLSLSLFVHVSQVYPLGESEPLHSIPSSLILSSGVTINDVSDCMNVLARK